MVHTFRGLRYDGGRYDVTVEVTPTPDALELDEILSVEEVSRDPVLLVEDVDPGLEEAIEEAVVALPLEDFACNREEPVLQSVSVLEVVATLAAEHTQRHGGGKVMDITLKLKGTHKGTAKFGIGRNTVRMPLVLFPNGTAPAELTLAVADGAVVIPTAKAKLTKEERAAARAAMTPEQKLAAAQAKVEAANKKLAKLQGELAL